MVRHRFIDGYGEKVQPRHFRPPMLIHNRHLHAHSFTSNCQKVQEQNRKMVMLGSFWHHVMSQIIMEESLSYDL